MVENSNMKLYCGKEAISRRQNSRPIAFIISRNCINLKKKKTIFLIMIDSIYIFKKRFSANGEGGKGRVIKEKIAYFED